MPLVKAAETGIPPLNLVTEAIGQLDTSDISMSPAWAVVEDYIRSQPIGSQVKVEIVGFDCVDPCASRIKVYIRGKHVSLAAAKDMFTLGGRLRDEHITRALGFMEELWRLVLSIPAEAQDEEELSPSNPSSAGHRTGGLLFNFELKPGNPYPVPKLYIPVRHYARSDIDVAKGLATFFRRQGWYKYADSYVKNVQDIL